MLGDLWPSLALLCLATFCVVGTFANIAALGNIDDNAPIGDADIEPGA